MAFRSTSQFRFEASKAAEATGRPGLWLRRERSGGSRPVDSREQQFASLDLPADRGQPRFNRLRKFGKQFCSKYAAILDGLKQDKVEISAVASRIKELGGIDAVYEAMQARTRVG